jgi:hypothetical protein
LAGFVRDNVDSGRVIVAFKNYSARLRTRRSAIKSVSYG